MQPQNIAIRNGLWYTEKKFADGEIAMQTRKLYYEDSHLRTFSAKVLSCENTEKGFAVVLEATAFYPEGGG